MSFLNTLPLIDGLERLRDVAMRACPPSGLLDQLLEGQVDVALCSSIDYQRSTKPLVIVPAGLLGCDGPTLTVRLFSAQPMQHITRVSCDTDSHTSIALLQILLRELYGVDPQLTPYDAGQSGRINEHGGWPQAMLLIGDKVVSDPPPPERYPHQLDLGDAWVRHTGLPFVFAAWMALRETDPDRLRTAGRILDRQRRHNRGRIDAMIHRCAATRRWPRALAAEYLKCRIAHEWTDERRRGLELFHDKAASHGLIARRRPIELLEL